jgi:SagB-type dehydrogenase family enzyme
MDEQEIQRRIRAGRDFLKAPVEDPEYQSDQELKKPQPPLFKAPMGGTVCPLSMDFSALPVDNDFLHVINTRESRRVYAAQPMNLLQLSYLLWCTQGVKAIRGRSYAALRTVPCGGARHEFECYLAVRNAADLPAGFYHYLPQKHALECLRREEHLEPFLGSSTCGQNWTEKAAAVFYYSCVCCRAEWRYGIYAHRIVMADIGYVSENLYLAAASIGLGSCALGSIDRAVCDQAFGLDGEEEFMLLAHPVGTVDARDRPAEADFYAFVKEQGL